MTRSDEQVDREVDRMWERLDALSTQMATLTEKTTGIESSIRTMAESTGRAVNNLVLCGERGVELAHTKDRVTKLEQIAVDRRSFENTVCEIRREILSIKKLLCWVGGAIAVPLIAMAVHRVFGA